MKYTEKQQMSDIKHILNQHQGYVNTNFITFIMLETDNRPIYVDLKYDKGSVGNKEFIQKAKKQALHALERHIDKKE